MNFLLPDCGFNEYIYFKSAVYLGQIYLFLQLFVLCSFTELLQVFHICNFSSVLCERDFTAKGFLPVRTAPKISETLLF